MNDRTNVLTDKQLTSSLNRNANFSLSQKRVLKEMNRTAADATAQVAANVPIQQDVYGSTLIYGNVTWLSGLTFEVSAAQYIIDGVTYNSPQTELTLTAADATHPRIDVIWVDINGTAGYTTGTPAADPAKPEVDPLAKVEMTFVTVAANATEPGTTSAYDLYLENAGDSAEWDATESTSAARIALASTDDAYSGTKSIKFTDALIGDVVTLTAGAGSTFDLAQTDSFEFHIKLVTFQKKETVRVAFFEGANRISSWVTILGGAATFGGSSVNVGPWQTINVPKSVFNFTGTPDSMQIDLGGRGNPMTLYIDQIRAQYTDFTQGNSNTDYLTESELINTVREFNVQQSFGNGTLTDGATIAWDLDTAPIASVTLDGNRTINPSNIRAGGTYILRVIQDDTTGSRTVTWNAAIEWAGGTAPTLSTAVDSVDVFSFVSFDGTTLQGATAGLAFA